jgi:hypothetical protein
MAFAGLAFPGSERRHGRITRARDVREQRTQRFDEIVDGREALGRILHHRAV